MNAGADATHTDTVDTADTAAALSHGYQVLAVPGLPEIASGDDVAALLGDALAASGVGLAEGDILCVTSKILSKAEGRVVAATDREAAIDAEMVRLVARRGPTRIVQTRHGFVMAAAGVDASNTPAGTVLLLPEDPDASARALAESLRARFGVAVGVVVTDTFGRPWREGQTDVAIGAAYVDALVDHRGSVDSFGNELQVTAAAVVDELAGAAEVVKGKADGVPVAVVRGLGHLVGDAPGAGVRPLIRSGENDMFALGTAEAMREAVMRRRTVRFFTDEPVSGEAVRRAVAAAVTAPAPHHTTPWRFVLLESESVRKTLLDAMAEAWRADLVGDGFSPESIAKRLKRGEVLRRAPYLVVPCLVAAGAGAHQYPDARRAAAEREIAKPGRDNSDPKAFATRFNPQTTRVLGHTVKVRGSMSAAVDKDGNLVVTGDYSFVYALGPADGDGLDRSMVRRVWSLEVQPTSAGRGTGYWFSGWWYDIANDKCTVTDGFVNPAFGTDGGVNTGKTVDPYATTPPPPAETSASSGAPSSASAVECDAVKPV